MFEAQILITEMSFVAAASQGEDTQVRAHAPGRHPRRRERFKNEIIIASHFSTRYHSKQIRQYVEAALPDMLEGRLHLWL